MKYFLLLLVLAILGSVLWFGFGTYRRNAMLDSGRPVLLISRDRGIYTYSDLLEREDITRVLKVVGYADELTAEQIQEFTAGLTFFSGVMTDGSDPRAITPIFATAQIPTALEQQRWTSVLASLTAQQTALCNNLSEAVAVQYCLSRHVAYQAVATKSPLTTCDALYISDQRAECVRDVSGGTLDVFIDQNKNTLIDLFEQLAIPYEQRANPNNLPIVNPTE